MSLERWETYIKTKPGQEVDPTFFVSYAEKITAADGVTVRYLVVGSPGSRGLEPGVYIQTNITPEGYNGDFNLRNAIRSHIVLDLMERSTKPPSVIGGNGSQLDFANAISFQQRAVAPNGVIVLRLNPADPTEVDQRLKDVESGNTRMKFVPKPPTP